MLGSWRLVCLDGYLVSVVTSVLCRCCLLLYHQRSFLDEKLTFGLVLPGLILIDLSPKIRACHRAKNRRPESIYVTTASKMTTLSEDVICHNLPRSATYSGRCALTSILAAAPKNTTNLSRTKTWCGPLDGTMSQLVGEKYHK